MCVCVYVCVCLCVCERVCELIQMVNIEKSISTFPLATVEVAISNTKAGFPFTGAPTANGFVPSVLYKVGNLCINI